MRVALRGALRFTSHRFTAGDLNFFWGFGCWLFVCVVWFVFHDFEIIVVVLRSERPSEL